MTGPDSTEFGDEVPVADAVEQIRPAREDADEVSDDGGGSAPLEAGEPDWQEQQQVVDDPDDEFR